MSADGNAVNGTLIPPLAVKLQIGNRRHIQKIAVGCKRAQTLKALNERVPITVAGSNSIFHRIRRRIGGRLVFRDLDIVGFLNPCVSRKNRIDDNITCFSLRKNIKALPRSTAVRIAACDIELHFRAAEILGLQTVNRSRVRCFRDYGAVGTDISGIRPGRSLTAAGSHRSTDRKDSKQGSKCT